jgi:hypothetical protein
VEQDTLPGILPKVNNFLDPPFPYSEIDTEGSAQPLKPVSSRAERRIPTPTPTLNSRRLSVRQ